MEIKAKSTTKPVTETKEEVTFEGDPTTKPAEYQERDYAEMERKALKNQIFLNLIQAKATTGAWDFGTLPDNKVLVRDLNHIKGIAEIAATVITTESTVVPKPAGR